jgi:hypothetical protein
VRLGDIQGEINMTRVTKIAALTLACGVFYVSPASAQATRTWVSGVGDDVNPCSRTAPCKTFAGAISKTAAGGEINCLDPGGFGAVTITKAMTINCIYTEGGVLAGGNGIVVNAGATDVVFLRGLDIFGVNPPSNGVRIIAGGAVHIESSTIRRFNAANSFGISFQPSGATQLYISDTTIATNGNGATGGGILIQPTGAGGSARVEMTNVRVLGNANQGVRIDTTGNTGVAGIIVTVERSHFAGNPLGININTPAATSSVQMFVNQSVISNNSGTGINAVGGANRTRVANSTITGNGTGIGTSGGAIINSFGTNNLDGNGADGTFTPPIINPE